MGEKGIERKRGRERTKKFFMATETKETTTKKPYSVHCYRSNEGKGTPSIFSTPKKEMDLDFPGRKK